MASLNIAENNTAVPHTGYGSLGLGRFSEQQRKEQEISMRFNIMELATRISQSGNVIATAKEMYEFITGSDDA